MSGEDITTILGRGSAFEGKLTFEGTVRIDGRFKGEIVTEGTLIVGETIGGRYTAFDIAEDGQLSEGRVWADFDDHNPDGCALDAAGGIWFADPSHSRVVRTEEGGTITDTIELEVPAWACMLGGSDGRTLYLLTAPDFRPAGVEGKGLGSILATTVEHPHAGLP